MSWLSSNTFLALTAFTISLVMVGTSMQTSLSGWVYQSIELFLIFAVSFGVLKLVSSKTTQPQSQNT
ncbi:hypothetical protein [Alkalicoccobacillus murimartini]|uniref:Uncharacterized protein n=1 Tax=Alkalicoccobacillus murimartini TaxID=171685 RepID=A0ABT9YLP7_9BACI|nr:hypothetical protein [Alkalicoccobacillus murimartini]MDQ0208410.1 hypothetical protein [Alkalicoccobacillus murimartini]